MSKFDPGAGRDNDCVCASPCQPRQRDLPSIIYFEQFVDSSLVGTLLVSQISGDFQALPAVALNNQAIRRRNVNSGIARSNRCPAGKITRIRFDRGRSKNKRSNEGGGKDSRQILTHGQLRVFDASLVGARGMRHRTSWSSRSSSVIRSESPLHSTPEQRRVFACCHASGWN